MVHNVHEADEIVFWTLRMCRPSFFLLCVVYVRGTVRTYSAKKRTLWNRKKTMTHIPTLLQKYPGKVPILLHVEDEVLSQQLSFKKYLIRSDATFGEFQYAVRSKCTLTHEHALCFSVGRSELCPISETVGTMYQRYVPEKDRVLDVYVFPESTFGENQ